eukprot:TRINITY_DN47728_c0_g1_i1.p2 TRINITY_DN47728_c0_g1~~TRINITY_DN47728_c0_g1_i1.p2  ORF type:complete len:218 (+),score=23.00 TRINITY_DN47728_c0_g1_i1:232-885(+)
MAVHTRVLHSGNNPYLSRPHSVADLCCDVDPAVEASFAAPFGVREEQPQPPHAHQNPYLRSASAVAAQDCRTGFSGMQAWGFPHEADPWAAPSHGLRFKPDPTRCSDAMHRATAALPLVDEDTYARAVSYRRTRYAGRAPVYPLVRADAPLSAYAHPHHTVEQAAYVSHSFAEPPVGAPSGLVQAVRARAVHGLDRPAPQPPVWRYDPPTIQHASAP